MPVCVCVCVWGPGWIEGTNVEKGSEMLIQSGIECDVVQDLDEAAKAAVSKVVFKSSQASIIEAQGAVGEDHEAGHKVLC
jgi:hypothetical protein